MPPSRPTHRLLLPLLAATLAVTACERGPGGWCWNAGYACLDDAMALECRDGAWRALPCSGPEGCSVSEEEEVFCDASLNVPGDLCAHTSEESGTCSPGGSEVWVCRDGQVTVAEACSSCAVSGGRVQCQP